MVFDPLAASMEGGVLDGQGGWVDSEFGTLARMMMSGRGG